MLNPTTCHPASCSTLELPIFSQCTANHLARALRCWVLPRKQHLRLCALHPHFQQPMVLVAHPVADFCISCLMPYEDNLPTYNLNIPSIVVLPIFLKRASHLPHRFTPTLNPQHPWALATHLPAKVHLWANQHPPVGVYLSTFHLPSS